MAIEVTTFNYPTDPNNNINEVYDWLTENASEYFPGGIVKDTDHLLIRVYPIEGDNRTQMAIPFRNNSSDAAGCVLTKYGTQTYQVNPNGTAHNNNAYKKAVKTSCGFVLLSNVQGATWFAAKTGHGSVCTCAFGSLAYGAGTFGLVTCDLENDITPIVLGPWNTLAILVSTLRYVSGGAATALVPLTFRCGTYSTSLLYTPFTQATFYGDLQTVVIDGQEYVYDGLIALKG